MSFVWELDNLPNIKIIIKMELSEPFTINWSKKESYLIAVILLFLNLNIHVTDQSFIRTFLWSMHTIIKKKIGREERLPWFFGEGGGEGGVLTFQINTIFWYSLSMNSPSWTGTTIRALSMNTVLVRCWATWTLEGSLNLTKHTRVAVPRWTMGSLKNSHTLKPMSL